MHWTSSQMMPEKPASQMHPSPVLEQEPWPLQLLGQNAWSQVPPFQP
jgi:hypothetical protein